MAFRRSRRQEASPEDTPLSAQALARVLELVQAVASEVHPEDVLDSAVDAAIDLTEAERGWILIQRPDAGLEVAVARRRGGVALEQALDKVSRTVVEQALQEDRPLCVDEARLDASLATAPSVAAMRLRAVLCVPFRLSEARGVFYLDNRFASGIFGPEALQLLAAFAGPVAMVLRHATLERQLAESAQALASSNRDLDARLRDRTAEVRRLESLAVHAEGSSRRDLFAEILGESPALLALLKNLERAAAGDFPVLLRGESGVGKELCARALHRVSSRCDHPFVVVAGAAVQGPLLEAELFGVRKGAYTGADRDRDGLLSQAGSGTLFLDGLDALPLEVQPRLLRVLEDGSFRPVGGGPPLQSQARVVAAVRQDLAEAVRLGAFREDLYYRVRVFEIVVPPLRERAADIPLLFEHFLEAAAKATGLAAVPPPADAQAALRKYAWPGNVRELANFATRWVALGGQLGEADWPWASASASADQVAAPSTLQNLAEQRILEVLEETSGNKAEAARRLGISRRTLYNRLQAMKEGERPEGV
ncbi:MAG: GAF domain-containing protein [Planctomycetota bacterium]|nr:MAG: GAF domain-containing protein [Planctomycetota bacterium]